MDITEINKLTNATKEFMIETLICEKCGEIKFINITEEKEIKNEDETFYQE